MIYHRKLVINNEIQIKFDYDLAKSNYFNPNKLSEFWV